MQANVFGIEPVASRNQFRDQVRDWLDDGRVDGQTGSKHARTGVPVRLATLAIAVGWLWVRALGS